MNKKRIIKVAKIILGVIGAAGFISMALVAPNALQALGVFYPNNKRKYNKNSYIKRSIYRLKESGFIEFCSKGNKNFIYLTEKGKQKLLKYKLRDISIKKPAQWDGKWRIIIFDIKEIRRGIRDAFRGTLINLGFVRLQNSVWVYPYECEEVIILLKTSFKSGKEILYIIADHIENDKWLRAKFGV